jgi:hypothetical protein
MEISGNRSAMSVCPYAKQDGSLQNKEVATYYYLEAVR